MATSQAKQLPYCEDSERAVLSGVLTASEDELYDTLLKAKPEYFFSRGYRIIFQGIVDLNKRGMACDMIALINYLKSLNRIEEIGGEHVIYNLLSVYYPNVTVSKSIDVLKEKYRLRTIIDVCESVKEEAYRGSESSDLVRNIEDHTFSLGTEMDSSENKLARASLEVERMIEVRRNKESCKGLLSGISSFDEVYNGFQKGQYYVLGGRPSAGKTAFADQVAVNLVARDVPFLYICLEAGDSRVLSKMVCKHAGVSYTKFSRGNCNPAELDSVEKSTKIFKESSMILKRPFSIKGSDIRSIIKRDVRRNHIELVIMDYLQKIDIGREDERLAISQASKAIQDACVETGIPALILAQLNRDNEPTKRPSMSELKGSGQIEQDADSIAFLWPEEDPFDVPMDQLLPVNLSIEKNKDGVRGLDMKLYFDRPLMTFKERNKK